MTEHSQQEISRRLEVALSASHEAGKLTLEFFRDSELRVDRKSDDSPVTEADRGAEILLREHITAAFPEDGILGEEFPEVPSKNGLQWIVDPIDGTKSFIHGVPLYSTLIALTVDDRPVMGIIRLPALDEVVYAARGMGAWYVRQGGESQPARVSSVDKVSESLFVTSEVASFDEYGTRDAHDRLQSACRLSRSWGDGYGYFLVATGRAEIMVDPIINLWDIAAMLPIIEEAGGRFTDWQGNPTIRTPQTVATCGPIHDEVLGLLK